MKGEIKQYLEKIIEHAKDVYCDRLGHNTDKCHLCQDYVILLEIFNKYEFDADIRQKWDYDD